MSKNSKIPPRKNADELTEKEIRFCEEYLIDFNATRAAISAGYSKKTAGQAAARLLKNVKVQAELDRLKKGLRDKLEVSRERTLQEIARVAFQDVRIFFKSDGSLIPIHELGDDAAAVISSMEIEELKSDGMTIGSLKKIKRFDKVKALEMLAKHYKVFEEGPVINNNFNMANLTNSDLKALLDIKQKAAK